MILFDARTGTNLRNNHVRLSCSYWKQQLYYNIQNHLIGLTFVTYQNITNMGNTIPIPESLQEEGEDGLPRTPRLAGFMQSTNMDSIDDTFGSSKGTPKEKYSTDIRNS